MYEGDSETPFTGVMVHKHENGKKALEGTFKDGKPEGLSTAWQEGRRGSESRAADRPRSWAIPLPRAAVAKRMRRLAIAG